MKWRKFPLKYLELTLVTLFSTTPNVIKINDDIAKKSMSGSEWDSLKEIIVSQTLLSKLWYIGQICNIPKYTKEEYMISSGTGKKIQPPWHVVQLFSILKSGLDILAIIETQLNSLKIKWIQRFLNPNNALWKNLMLYLLNLILNYILGLAPFRQKQILGS